MDFRAEISAATNVVLDTFGEEVIIRGNCLRGVVRDDAYAGAGLDVSVTGRIVQVSISTVDADRLQLVKDEEVEFRGQHHRIRAFDADSYGLTRIEVG